MSVYADIWEFQVSAQHRLEFEKHYGEEGPWVALFRQSPAFIGTKLLQKRPKPLRYTPIDCCRIAQIRCDTSRETVGEARKRIGRSAPSVQRSTKPWTPSARD